MKESEYFDLKIGSRYVTQYDYAEHLERMMKRATTWDELIVERSDSHGKTLNKVTVFTPATGDTKEYSALEWKDVCYDVIYGNEKVHLSYDFDYLFSEEEIVEALDSKKPTSFFISTKR